MKITFLWNGKTTVVDGEEGRTLLDLALMAGIQPPYSCLEGRCGTCEAVVAGEIVRTCQVLPALDMVVDYDKRLST